MHAIQYWGVLTVSPFTLCAMHHSVSCGWAGCGTALTSVVDQRSTPWHQTRSHPLGASLHCYGANLVISLCGTVSVLVQMWKASIPASAAYGRWDWLISSPTAVAAPEGGEILDPIMYGVPTTYILWQWSVSCAVFEVWFPSWLCGLSGQNPLFKGHVSDILTFLTQLSEQ